MWVHWEDEDFAWLYVVSKRFTCGYREQIWRKSGWGYCTVHALLHFDSHAILVELYLVATSSLVICRCIKDLVTLTIVEVLLNLIKSAGEVTCVLKRYILLVKVIVSWELSM